MKLITKLAVVCILCTLFVCGGVSADSSPDSFCVELDGDIGHNNELLLNSVFITDCDGNQFVSNPTEYLRRGSKEIDLSGSGLNRDKPFKEVKLHLMLKRTWGFENCYERYDRFTLDVTDLVTKMGKSYTVVLNADHSYQVGKADAVTIYDCNRNKLKHFSSTHDEGWYGSWDYSFPDIFCVDLDCDIGFCNSLCFEGFCITDCNGNQFASKFTKHWRYGGSTKIDLSGSGLNRDKPFKEVKLYFTLERRWGFGNCYERYDKFTLDVTDVVTKKKGKSYTVLLKADNSYQVGKADAVTIYDGNKNELKHFSSTHKYGHYGSWDYSLPDLVCVDLADGVGYCNHLCFDGVCITDCDGNQFASIFTKDWSSGGSKKIDLSDSGLNCDNPFKEVKLYFTLERRWGYGNCYERYDKFTLDVTDVVTKNENEPYTVRLKADNSYQVGKADAVTIYDGNKNELKHFPSTHDDGRYGSWDYPLPDLVCVDLVGDVGYCNILWFGGFCITDCDGNQFASKFTEDFTKYSTEDWSSGGSKKIDLSDSDLNCDKPFKEVKLYFTLKRKWGFNKCYERFDKFTLDVTDVVTKNENEPYTVRLKVDNSYQVGKTDAVTIYDGNKNKLKHFPATHDEGEYGSWD